MRSLSTGYAAAYSASFIECKFECECESRRVDIPFAETRSPMHDSSDHVDAGEPVYVAFAKI